MVAEPQNREPIGRPLQLRNGSPPVDGRVLTTSALEQPLTPQQVRDVLHALEAAADTTPAARPHARHGWSFIDDACARRADPAALLAAATRLDAAVDAVHDVAAAARIDRVTDPADLAAAAQVLAFPQAFPIDTVERAVDPRWRAAGLEATTRLRAFSSAEHAVLRDLDRSGLDLPLEQLQREAQAAVDGGYPGRRKRLRAVAAKFGPALGTKARAALTQLPKLAEAAIDVRTARDTATHAVFSVPGLTGDAGDPFDPAWPDRLDARRAALIDLADRWTAVREQSPLGPLVDDVLRRRTPAPDGLAALLAELAAAIEGVRSQLGAEPTTWLAGDGWTVAGRATAADRALERSGSTTLHRWLEHVIGLRELHDLAGTPVLQSFYDDLISGVLPIEGAPEAIGLAAVIPSAEEHPAAEHLGTARPG